MFKAYEPNTLAVNVQQELEPFLASFDRLGAQNEKFQQFRRNYQSFKARYRNAKQIEEFVTKGIAKNWIDPNEWENPNFIFLVMFAYLGLVETVGNCVVDILVMLLVANGRDFHMDSDNGSHIKHVTSISSLKDGRVDLAIKLDFLKENGVTFFSNIVDTRLRNDIAHLNFRLIGADDWVEFSTRLSNGKSYKATAVEILMPRIRDLLYGIDVVVDLLSITFDEKLS